MGTDIHLEVEVVNSSTGKWERKPGFIPGWGKPGYIEDADPLDRSYVVFAFLAGVRNGYGFAGVPTFNPIVPLAEGRGLPDDHSLDLNEWGADHSFTWVSALELLEAPWDIEVTRTGVIPAPAAARLAEYEKWAWLDREAGRWKRLDTPSDLIGRTAPEAWSGAVTGPGIITLRARDWFEAGMPGTEEPVDPDRRVYVQWTWRDHPLMKTGLFRWANTKLRRLAADHGDEKVRVLIGFDS